MLPGRELTIYDQSLSALRVSYGHTERIYLRRLCRDSWIEFRNHDNFTMYL